MLLNNKTLKLYCFLNYESPYIRVLFLILFLQGFTLLPKIYLFRGW